MDRRAPPPEPPEPPAAAALVLRAAARHGAAPPAVRQPGVGHPRQRARGAVPGAGGQPGARRPRGVGGPRQRGGRVLHGRREPRGAAAHAPRQRGLLGVRRPPVPPAQQQGGQRRHHRRRLQQPRVVVLGDRRVLGGLPLGHDAAQLRLTARQAPAPAVERGRLRQRRLLGRAAAPVRRHGRLPRAAAAPQAAGLPQHAGRGHGGRLRRLLRLAGPEPVLPPGLPPVPPQAGGRPLRVVVFGPVLVQPGWPGAAHELL